MTIANNQAEIAPTHVVGATFDLVALATSAGGLAALSQVLAGLPPSFPAAIVVVQPLNPHRHSLLADILSQRTSLRVKQAEAGDLMMSGTVYITPPNYHLLVEPIRCLSLSQTKPVNFVRPSADRLFELVAAIYRERVIAVVLPGGGSD